MVMMMMMMIMVMVMMMMIIIIIIINYLRTPKRAVLQSLKLMYLSSGRMIEL
jgi:hypothetical protein